MPYETEFPIRGGTRMKKAFLYVVVLVISVFSSIVHSHASIGAEFPIATTAVALSAAFDGTNYLVGLEYNHNGTADQIDTHVGAQMVSSTGAKIGSVIETTQHGIAQSIAFDGTNYLMVWEDNQGLSPTNCNLALYGQFISKAGTAVGTSFVISSGIEYDGINILSYGSGKYLVTYTKLINIAQCENSTNRYIAGRIIFPDGTMGSEFRISTGNGAKNSMTFDGTNFFVVWVEDSQDYEVRGRVVSPTSALGTEISINATTAPSDNIPPTVAFDGTNYMVVWNDEVNAGTGDWDVFGQLVKPDGSLVGGVINIAQETGGQFAASIAFDGANYFAVWIDMQNDTDKDGVCDAGEGTCWDVYGQYISKDGALVGNKVAISTDAGNQLGVVGYNNGKYLVLVSSGIVLGDGITQGGDVYGIFITPSDTPALKYILTVTKAGTGTGKITSSPSGIDCGSVCSAEYDQGTVVTLTPVPDTGSIFAGWSGGGCTGNGICVTTVNTDTLITATFTVQVGDPKISVSPKSVNFGSTKTGVTSNPKTVTIRNTGKGYLAINSITITGTNAGEFNQINDCSTISPGNSCAVNASFIPAFPFEKKSATISISSNDPKKPTINVKLSGKAAPPKISASPKSVNFGSVQVGDTSSPKIITIKNTGVSDLVISDINITGTNAGEFNQTNGCSTITSGNSCTINATFTPTTPSGAKSATISISSNDSKKPTVNVKLKGKSGGSGQKGKRG